MKKGYKKNTKNINNMIEELNNENIISSQSSSNVSSIEEKRRNISDDKNNINVKKIKNKRKQKETETNSSNKSNIDNISIDKDKKMENNLETVPEVSNTNTKKRTVTRCHKEVLGTRYDIIKLMFGDAVRFDSDKVMKMEEDKLKNNNKENKDNDNVSNYSDNIDSDDNSDDININDNMSDNDIIDDMNDKDIINKNNDIQSDNKSDINKDNIQKTININEKKKRGRKPKVILPKHYDYSKYTKEELEYYKEKSGRLKNDELIKICLDNDVSYKDKESGKNYKKCILIDNLIHKNIKII